MVVIDLNQLRNLIVFLSRMKKVAIVQSNYVPWKGYFDMIAAVDEFILYDAVQYTRRDWRNRNKIKTPQGLQWLTVPVKVKGKYHQKIEDTEIEDVDWALMHWKALAQNYRKTPHFDEIASWLEPLYISETYTHLSQLNRRLINSVSNYLGLETKISSSADYTLVDGRTERLADLCDKAGGTEYVSGPAAKSYIEQNVFDDRNIKLTWFDYSGYPVYPQLWGEFVHGVTVLDLIFNCGKKAPDFMRHVRR